MFPKWFFVFLKHYFTESIVRKFCAEFKRDENVGENQKSDCSAFAHAFVGRSNPLQADAFSQLYDQQTDKACITLSNSDDLAKDSEEEKTTAYFCDHF